MGYTHGRLALNPLFFFTFNPPPPRVFFCVTTGVELQEFSIV